MHMDMSVTGMWGEMGWPARVIIIMLGGMLVWSLYVTFDRLMLFVRSRAQSRDLAAAISKPLSTGDLDGALKLVNSPLYKLAYLGNILRVGLTEFRNRPDRHGIEASKRGLERLAITEAAALRKGMNVLATTGSTAPFLGLVGTIFGIITAFKKMASSGGGDLTAISGGIAEALVSTAVGIAIAIIGVWIYNYFNAAIDEIQKDMTTSIQELVDYLEKDLLRRSETQAAK